jgi:RNA polymerase sigma factor (sigma-70 family)
VVFSKFDNDDDSNVLTDTLTDTEPLPEELFDRALAAGEVQTALQTLKPRDRMLLSLRYDEELSFEDIAKIMKISANTIRSLHRRALMSLRAVLEQK